MNKIQQSFINQIKSSYYFKMKSTDWEKDFIKGISKLKRDLTDTENTKLNELQKRAVNFE